MKQSDTLSGLILIPLTLSLLFCRLQAEICRAERKVCLFCFVSPFFFLLLCQPALLDTFSGAVCCFVLSCCFFFFFWCSLFHLTNDLTRFRVQFRSCFTVQPPLLTDILTFTHFPKLTRHLHTPNKSILRLARHGEMRQLIAALKTCRLLLMFLVHLGWRRADPESPTSVCVCVATCVCCWGLVEMGGVSCGFRLAAAPRVRIRALSPLVYLTQLPALCSLSSLLCLTN